MPDEIAEPLNIQLVQDGLNALFGDTPPVVAAAEPVVTPEQVTEFKPPAQDPIKEPVKVDELPENLPNEGRSDAWKKFRTQYKSLETDLKIRKEELADFEGTKKERDELKQQIAAHETRINELSEVDSLSKLENLPDFRSKYSEPRNQGVEKLKELAGYADIDVNELMSAMNKTGKDRYVELENILSSAPTTLQSKITAVIDQIESLDTERTNELSNARESLERRQREQTEYQTRERQKQREYADTAFNHAAKDLSEKLVVSEDVIKKARDFFTKANDPKAAAEVIIKAFASDTIFETQKQKDARIKELEEELSGYRSAEPGLVSGSRGNVTDANKDASFIDAILAGAQSVGIR